VNAPPLPPPLLLTGEDATGLDNEVELVGDGDLQMARAFGAVLNRARAAGGHTPGRPSLFAPEEPLRPPPPSPEEQVWVPHIFCWLKMDAVALTWELVPLTCLESLFGGSLEDVIRWARRPDLLLRLARLASRGQTSGEHLSFRWLIANQERAALALAAEKVTVEHISLHVEAEAMDRVVELLTTAVGLVEIPRPSTITIPGRWLQAGNSRVHLNSREACDDEVGFPGPRPNHLCFAVANPAEVERALAAQGVATEQAGSLAERQIWFRLPGGCVVELQPSASYAKRGP
jgi:hypothetical protein